MVSPGSVAGIVVVNIAILHRPLHAIGERGAAYPRALPGLCAKETSVLNEALCRALERLIDRNRVSLLTETVLHVDNPTRREER